MKIFRTKYKVLNFWLDTAVIFLVMFAAAYMFFWPARVDGNSMAPTLQHGDQVITSRFLANFGTLNVGDIVLVQVEDRTVIKRIADILDDGTYFVLGDNLLTSVDSRHFGPVENRHILAKIIFKYFPFTEINFY